MLRVHRFAVQQSLARSASAADDGHTLHLCFAGLRGQTRNLLGIGTRLLVPCESSRASCPEPDAAAAPPRRHVPGGWSTSGPRRRAKSHTRETAGTRAATFVVVIVLPRRRPAKVRLERRGKEGRRTSHAARRDVAGDGHDERVLRRRLSIQAATPSETGAASLLTSAGGRSITPVGQPGLEAFTLVLRSRNRLHRMRLPARGLRRVPLEDESWPLQWRRTSRTDRPSRPEGVTWAAGMVAARDARRPGR